MALSLLILQPTPFCNIDCDYCYLASRTDSSRMTMNTLQMAIERVLSSGLVEGELSVVWHAGEPLTLPVEYYAEAFAIIEKTCPPKLAIHHSIQSNGLLLDGQWCGFIRDRCINIGLSIDGPAWLHDRHRKTRRGQGTHARAMAGLELLRAQEIPFHVIAVLTRESLAHADELFDFFLGHGVRQLCFNIEEIEAENTRSSLSGDGVEDEFRGFFERILDRLRGNPGSMGIREVEDVFKALRHPEFGAMHVNSLNSPFEIINIAYDGQFSTFSPELLGTSAAHYGNFAFGNVHRDEIKSVISTEKFQRVAVDIAEGVRACHASCKYFPFCRGGAPSNKLAELGAFTGTETLYCRLTQKILIECVLTAIESDLGDFWI